MSADDGVLGRADRVFLRRPKASDRVEYLEIRRRSAEMHQPWEPETPKGFDPFGDEAFDRMLESASTPSRERMLVCREDVGSIVGLININEIVRGAFQSGFLGYWVDVRAAGMGFMTDGMRLAVRHAFTTLGLHRLEANIQPHNERSIALVRRCGFRKEGFSPRYLQIRGVWCDHERWALLVEDWRAMPQSGG